METLKEIAAKLDELLTALSAPRQAEQRFFGIDQAAAYSGLSADSLRRLIARGELTGLRPIKGKVLIDRGELDALILGSTRQPAKGRGSGLAVWREKQARQQQEAEH